MPSATSDDQVLQMFQRLLAERFRLMFHWSEQPTKAYALEVDKKGAKLNPTVEGTPPFVGVGQLSLNAKNKSMEDLANILMRWTDRPVLDLTELHGRYDFKLEWGANFDVYPDQSVAPVNARTRLSTAPLNALSSLGLKVVVRTFPVRFLMVDSVDQSPVEN
jgi:uncharacterized protein (TIGR03435 family)